MGWVNNLAYANDVPTYAWRGGFSIPRKLSLFQQDGIYQLKQTPIVSDNIFTEKLTLQPNQKINAQTIALKDNLYRLVLNIKLLATQGFDLNLLKNSDEKSVLSYNVATETLSFDRTKSGRTDFNDRYSTIESIKVKPKKRQLKLDILVDKYMVEIYANDGKKVLTDLIFPTKENGSIEIIWK